VAGGAPADGCTILVVEDDPDIRQAITALLDDDGYRVVAKADGAAALEWLRVGPLPCLVLLDLRMPVMDGSVFLAELRATPALQALPVCVLSADPAPAPPGATYSLRKPVAATALLRVLQRLGCRTHGGGAQPGRSV
jgi:CheY-like chemotaxis protein